MVRAGSSTGQTAATCASDKPAAGARKASRNAKIAAERIARQHHRPRREPVGDVAGGVHHFVDAIGMEQRLVEMVGIAVIAEIEPEHLETLRQQLRRGQAHIARLGTALPTMQQQSQAARGHALDAAVQALQAHAVAAVDDVLGGDRMQRRHRALAEPAPHRAGAQHRLQVRIA